MEQSNDNPILSFVSGIGSGVISQVIFSPIDVLKVRMQAVGRGEAASKNLLGSKEFVHMTKTIYRNEGLPGFFAGLKQSCFGAGVAWGLGFYLYNGTKQLMQKYKGEDKRLTTLDYFISSTVSGLISSTLMHPLFLLKTRFQLNATSAAEYHYKNSFDMIKRVLAEEGVNGLFVGLPASLLMSSHGIIFFMIYDNLKNLYLQKTKNQNISPLAGFGASAVAKVVATLFSHPFSVVKTRVQDQKNYYHNVKYDGIMDALFKMAKSEGLFTFYRGLVPQLMRSVTSGATTLFFYELFISEMREFKNSTDV